MSCERKMMYTLVAVLVAAVAVMGSAIAVAQKSAEQGHEHETHFEKCAKACADCQTHCDSCFQHCAELVAKGDKDHVKSMHACVDCAECCKLAATLSARHSPFAAAACECCAKCNDECAAACEKFPDDKHMAMREVVPRLRQGVPGNDQAPGALNSALADRPGAGLKPVPGLFVR